MLYIDTSVLLVFTLTQAIRSFGVGLCFLDNLGRSVIHASRFPGEFSSAALKDPVRKVQGARRDSAQSYCRYFHVFVITKVRKYRAFEPIR